MNQSELCVGVLHSSVQLHFADEQVLCAFPLRSSQCVCACVCIMSIDANCFDAISPALINGLICLTTSLSWRGKVSKTSWMCEVAVPRAMLQNLTFACISLTCCLPACICTVHMCILFCRVQLANRRDGRHFLSCYLVSQVR